MEAMRAEGLTKEMVGRDGFLERAWAWKTKYGNRIVSQLKKLGSSCDWERERFTMDEGCSEAVKEVFVRLYDKGLIYRGNRMVNWCPHCNTSISDAEVEYEEKDGNFWHLLYPVKETGEMLELATTRPETMLGDTAVAINGEDPPLCPSARLPRRPAPAEQGDPHRLRRARRHDQGHRRCQDHPGPRPQRL